MFVHHEFILTSAIVNADSCTLIAKCDLISFPAFLHPLQTSQQREQRLREAVALHQFQTDANDMEAWIQEALRRVSSTEVGHDEFSTQTLARKQREVEEDIQSHRGLIDSLHEQGLALPPDHAQSPEVCVCACFGALGGASVSVCVCVLPPPSEQRANYAAPNSALARPGIENPRPQCATATK